MASIKPTVGRVVWFYPCKGHPEQAAIVCHVHSDTLVNLAVFDGNGCQRSHTSIQLVQAGDAVPDQAYCAWMPYQQGQAAKTEAAEKVAEAARQGFKG